MEASNRTKLRVGSGSRVVGSKTDPHLNFLCSDTSFYRRMCRYAVCLSCIKYGGNLCRHTEELNLHCAIISARYVGGVDSVVNAWTSQSRLRLMQWDRGNSVHHKGASAVATVYAETFQPLCLCLKMADFAIGWKLCRTVS